MWVGIGAASEVRDQDSNPCGVIFARVSSAKRIILIPQ
jgi:hypothetical protein